MPAKPRSYIAVVKAAERTLRARRIDHAFVGGIAVLAFGEPRTTMDVDVVAAYRLQDAAPLAAEFRRRGFLASPEDLRCALSDPSRGRLKDTRSWHWIDLIPVTGAAEAHAIEGHRTVRWRGMALPIAAPEHTVVMKLVFTGEKNLRDALGILVRQRGRLDVRRMRAFARDRGVIEELRDLESMARTLGRPGRR